ncbi:MAG: hypothetical protein H6Q04_59 [Acidobacteria bacterium]|jgi:hypothetical protein|nr:hypothetical protein [Acidobacteriota bacterium]
MEGIISARRLHIPLGDRYQEVALAATFPILNPDNQHWFIIFARVKSPQLTIRIIASYPLPTTVSEILECLLNASLKAIYSVGLDSCVDPKQR